MLNRSTFWLAIIHYKKNIDITLKVYYNPSSGDRFCTYIDFGDRSMLFCSDYHDLVSETAEPLIADIRSSDFKGKEQFLTEDFTTWARMILAALDG